MCSNVFSRVYRIFCTAALVCVTLLLSCDSFTLYYCCLLLCNCLPDNRVIAKYSLSPSKTHPFVPTLVVTNHPCDQRLDKAHTHCCIHVIPGMATQANLQQKT